LSNGNARSAPQTIDFALDGARPPTPVFRAAGGARGERALCPDCRTLKSIFSTRVADSGHPRFDVDRRRYRGHAFDRAGRAGDCADVAPVRLPADGPADPTR
jgi:hypothetical protein